MKSSKIFLLSACIIVFILLQGCIAAELAELGGIAEAGEIGAFEAGVMDEFGMAATAEEGLAIENTAAFNSNLGRLRFMPEGGTPRIGLMERGKLTPVADVLTEQNRLRLTNGKLIPMHNEIYAINANELIIRDAAGKSGTVIDKLSRGNIVVKLYEEDGWYRVRFKEYQEGYIDPAFLIFVGGEVADKKKHFALTHNRPLNSFIEDHSIKNIPGQKDVALVIADSITKDEILTSLVKAKLENEGYKVVTNLFNEGFIGEAYYQLFLNGTIKNFNKLHFEKYVDFICIVSKPTHYTSNQFKDMVSAKSIVNIQVFDAKTGTVVESKFYTLAGAGFNNSQAVQTLNNHIIQKIEALPFTF